MILEISDEQSQVLEAKAAAEGLSLENWLARLAQSTTQPKKIPYDLQSGRAAAAKIREIQYRSKPDPEGLTVLDYLHRDRR